MGKRNFKRKGSYAPKKARLVKVGENLASLPDPLTLNDGSNSPDTAGCSDIEFPTCGSNNSTISCKDNHSHTSTIGVNSSSPVASQKSDRSDTAGTYQDLFADGMYYVNIPANVQTTENSPAADPIEDEEEALPQGNIVKEFLSGQNIQMAVELLNLCNESQAALHYYDKFLALFQRYGKLSPDNTWWKTIPSRRTLLTKLKSKLSTVEPEICTLTSSEDIVPRFSFLEQLKDLLSMPYFQDIESCCVNSNKEDRFKMYQPGVEEGLSELPCAQWYRDTYQKTIGDTPLYVDPVTQETYHNWLFCLKWYNDKTGVSAMEGSYSLEPLVFTTGILRRHVQESHDAWRHIGFIPSRTVKKEDAKKKGVTLGEESLAFTHECISILLQEVIELQRNPPLLTLNLFGEVCKVRLILEVACVMGDQLSQDTHCCRKKINAGGAGRVHRSCMTSFMEAMKPHGSECIPVPKNVIDDLCEVVWMEEDNDKRQAHYASSFPVGGNGAGPIETEIIRVTKFRAKVAREILEKVFSLYPVKNAWSDVSFGSNENGIHYATVDDPMHYNSGGLFLYLAQIAFQGLKPSEAEELEGYLREDYTRNRSSVRYDLPRGKFSPGFTNCTLLTASEKVGIIYALYLSLGTKRVSDLYKKSILRQQQKYLDISCYDVSMSRPSGTSVRSGASRVTTSGCQPSLVGDKYYFKSGHVEAGQHCPMKRRIGDVRFMVDCLNKIGLLKILHPVIMDFDSLQTEYLFQITWDRVCKHRCLEQPILHLQTERIMANGTLTTISTRLYSTLRQNKTSHKILHSVGPVPTVIQKTIKKHFLDKPKILGLGDTSAILTDVQGFREVLESALIYHSLVHEFHHLDATWQMQLDIVQAKLDNVLNNLYNRIYRGDNGVDVGTCKCHSHFHLTSSIKSFGAPMGYDAGTGERNLKRWAKGVSKTARKCGQAMFMQQTASRVLDRLVLAKGMQFMCNKPNATIACISNLPNVTWKYTRKSPHVLYDLQTGMALLNQCKVQKENNLLVLLTNQIKEALKENHGPTGTIRIWKEIKIALDDGLSEHHVRAFHDFDVHGSFFDWAHVKEKAHDMDNYCPAKVLLLYQTDQCDDFALVWKARQPTDNERRHETNISARWKMSLMPNGLPKLESISTTEIESCVSVNTHWQSVDETLPVTDTSMFVIDESYERYSWALNFVDDERWKSCIG